MRKKLFLAAIIISSHAMAGGSSGTGTPPLLQDSLEIMASALQRLPKMYIDQDEFRRANARLSVVDATSISMNLNGENVQIKKIYGSLVDDEISKEILTK